MKDSLGDRIKKYENVTRFYATPRMPLIIRVDGRAFHTFTKNCKKPFDHQLIDAMCQAALSVSKEMQGFKCAYIQSDEVTFAIIDYDNITSQGWFDYNLSKIISLTAASMSVYFNKFYLTDKIPIFDCRAFSVPKEDVVNTFLWRMKDWERNSLSMYCRTFFSHKELRDKNKFAQHEMLFSIGKNWTTDLTNQEKNGTFIVNNSIVFCEPTFQSVNELIGNLFQ
jgi:tRNA(His) 5'-end guanylyltransferase